MRTILSLDSSSSSGEESASSAFARTPDVISTTVTVDETDEERTPDSTEDLLKADLVKTPAPFSRGYHSVEISNEKEELHIEERINVEDFAETQTKTPGTSLSPLRSWWPSRQSHDSENGTVSRILRDCFVEDDDDYDETKSSTMDRRSLETMRVNSAHIAVDESQMYLERISELEQALQRMQREAAMDGNQQVNGLSMEALWERNETLTKEVRLAEQTCVEVAAQSQDLKVRLVEAQEEVKELRQAHESHLEDQAGYRLRLQIAQEENEQLLEQLQEEGSTIQLEEAAHETRALRDELALITAQQAKSQSDGNTLQEQADSQQNRADLLQEENELLHQEKERDTLKIRALQDDHTKLREELDKIKETYQQSQDELSRAIGKENRLQQSLLNQEDRITSLTCQVKDAQLAQSVLEANYEKATRSLLEADKENQSLRQATREIENKLRKAQAKADTQTEESGAMAMERLELQEQLKSRLVRIDELEESEKALKHCISDLEQRCIPVETKADDVAALLRKVEEGEVCLEETREANTSLMAQITELKTDQQRLTLLSQDSNELRLRLERTELDLGRERQETTKATQEARSLARQLDESESRFRDCDKTITELHEQLEQLAHQHQTSTIEYDALQRAHSKQQDEFRLASSKLQSQIMHFTSSLEADVSERANSLAARCAAVNDLLTELQGSVEFQPTATDVTQSPEPVAERSMDCLVDICVGGNGHSPDLELMEEARQAVNSVPDMQSPLSGSINEETFSTIAGLTHLFSLSPEDSDGGSQPLVPPRGRNPYRRIDEMHRQQCDLEESLDRERSRVADLEKELAMVNTEIVSLRTANQGLVESQGSLQNQYEGLVEQLKYVETLRERDVSLHAAETEELLSKMHLLKSSTEEDPLGPVSAGNLVEEVKCQRDEAIEELGRLQDANIQLRSKESELMRMNEELKAATAKADAENTIQASEITDLRTTRDLLNATLRTTQDELKESNKSRKELGNQIEQTQRSLADLRREQGESENEKKSILSQLDTSRAAQESLRQDIVVLESQLSEMKINGDASKESYEEVLGRLHQTEEELDESRSRNKTLESQIEKESSEAGIAEGLRAEVTRLQIELDGRTDMLESELQESNQLRSLHDEADQKNMQLLEDLQRSQEDLASLERKYLAANEGLAANAEKILMLERSVEAAEELTTSAEERFLQTQDDLKKSHESLDDVANVVRKYLAETAILQNSLGHESKVGTEGLNATEIVDLALVQLRLYREMQELADVSSSDKLQEQEAQIRQLSDQMKSMSILEEASKKQAAELASYEERVESLNMTLRARETEVEQLERNVQQRNLLLQEQQDKVSKIGALERRQREAEEQLHQLQEEVHNGRVTQKSCENQLQTARNECNSMRTKYHRLQDHVRKLMVKCDEWENYYDRHGEVVIELKRSNARLRERVDSLVTQQQHLHRVYGQERAQWSAHQAQSMQLKRELEQVESILLNTESLPEPGQASN